MSNKIIFSILRYFIFPIFFLIIVLEIFFQIIFIHDLKSFKKTIMYFNPYCDQAYWNFEGNSSYDKTEYLYHPILTLIKKKNKAYFQNKISKKNEIIFYGSSFIDHKYFIPNYENKVNFAIKSYGLDQIYKSYMLTKNNFVDSTIIFGFLLEDIDRALFDQRNFPKLKYVKNNDNYKISNIPILFKDTKNKRIYFYTYNFIKNLIFLTTNEYDYKKSDCYINEKKDIFKYFINNIILNSTKLNQKVIFVTFNSKGDVIVPNWRYEFVKEYLSSNNLIHIDATEIIRDNLINAKSNILDFYNQEDLHLNKEGFNFIKKEINKFIEQYM